MRLSEWRAKAPFKNSVSPKVVAVLDSALDILGADRDPECWVVWGDDPSVRYLVLVPTPGGLAQVNVRVYVPGEGPRASGKVARWNRVQLGELGVELQGGHRLVTFQVETQVLNGADDVADRIAAFARALFAAVDGRAIVPSVRRAATPRRTTAGKAGAGKASAAKPATRLAPAGKAGSTKAGQGKAGPGKATSTRSTSAADAVPRLSASAAPRRAATKGPRS